jgi:cytochrome b/b6/petB-like protein
MPDENKNGGDSAPSTGNGKNGGKVGVLEKVTTTVKEDIQSLKTDIPTKVKEQVEGLKDPTKTQVYTSIFRHKHDDTPRNRALGVLSNVFLHLHPAKINRDAVRYSYTWGMGGITFYLFIVLTFTGVLLMFYYHPAVPNAYHDMKDLRFVVSNGVFLRNMHRIGAHLMVLLVFWHMFHVFYRGGYKPPHEFNWVVGVFLLLVTLLGRSRWRGGRFTCYAPDVIQHDRAAALIYFSHSSLTARYMIENP